MPLRIIRKFLETESLGGMVLFFAALFAMVVDNSFLSAEYQKLFNVPLTIQVGQFSISKPLLFWINEGLMTFFFLLVGLELKREFLGGELSNVSQIMLPSVAALGGMLIPALIFIAINYSHPETIHGWAIPVATDIAFALGVLSLLGSRVPLSLKLFLMALAIFDDMGAIVIISVFFAHDLSYLFLFLSAFVMFVLIFLNKRGISSLTPYLLLGTLLWLCVLMSGVHATIAGILLAFVIPFRTKNKKYSPLYVLEKNLYPWVALLVLPLFAFANAGVSLSGITFNTLMNPLPLGVILGLVIGKQIGVFSFAWLVIRQGWAKLPTNSTWIQFYGIAALCGIGFTMSLFLGTLAFQESDPNYLVQVRLSVLLGSILSGAIGTGILYSALRNKKQRAQI